MSDSKKKKLFQPFRAHYFPIEIIFKSLGSLGQEILSPFCYYFSLHKLLTTELPQTFIRNSQTQKEEGPNKNKHANPDLLGVAF